MIANITHLCYKVCYFSRTEKTKPPCKRRYKAICKGSSFGGEGGIRTTNLRLLQICRFVSIPHHIAFCCGLNFCIFFFYFCFFWKKCVIKCVIFLPPYPGGCYHRRRYRDYCFHINTLCCSRPSAIYKLFYHSFPEFCRNIINSLFTFYN